MTAARSVQKHRITRRPEVSSFPDDEILYRRLLKNSKITDLNNLNFSLDLSNPLSPNVSVNCGSFSLPRCAICRRMCHEAPNLRVARFTKGEIKTLCNGRYATYLKHTISRKRRKNYSHVEVHFTRHGFGIGYPDDLDDIDKEISQRVAEIAQLVTIDTRECDWLDRPCPDRA